MEGRLVRPALATAAALRQAGLPPRSPRERTAVTREPVTAARAVDGAVSVSPNSRPGAGLVESTGCIGRAPASPPRMAAPASRCATPGAEGGRFDRRRLPTLP